MIRGRRTTTIVSDDVPEISVAGTTTIAEGDSGQVTLTADQAPRQDLAVALTITGDATPGTDYQTVDPVVVLPAGATSATVTVASLTDAVIENDERVVVALGPGATSYKAGPVGQCGRHDSRRHGNARLPVVTVRTGTTHLGEGKPLVVTVALSQPLSEELEIDSCVRRHRGGGRRLHRARRPDRDRAGSDDAGGTDRDGRRRRRRARPDAFGVGRFEHCVRRGVARLRRPRPSSPTTFPSCRSSAARLTWAPGRRAASRSSRTRRR